jgi:hypothetical protein
MLKHMAAVNGLTLKSLKRNLSFAGLLALDQGE